MHGKSSKQCTGQLLTEKNYSYPNANRPKTRNPALLDQGHEKNGISCSSLWNVNGFLSQCLLPAHTKKHLACLWSQAGTTQIELVGGTESNTILCCCITPFPMEIKMLFRKSYSTGKELGVGARLISQMRKQEAWRGCHLLKVTRWIRFSAQETNIDLTLQRIPKGRERTGKCSLLEAILEAQIFSTSWASGDEKSRVSCDGWLVVLPRISSPRRVSQPLPASWRALTWQTQFPGLFSRCLHCQVI